jgi:hypothetical protein
MLTQHQHARKTAKRFRLHALWPHTSPVPGSILLLTVLAFVLALHAIGQTNEPVWPAPGALHFALAHLL